MDPVTLYAPDGRSVVIRTATMATNLRASGYRDTPPDSVAVATEDPTETPVEFDPADHTIDEVQAFLEEHPELAEGVLASERSGKNRAGLVGS